MLNEFTCLPKTTLYVPKQQSTKGNSEDSKVIRLLENSFQVILFFCIQKFILGLSQKPNIILWRSSY